MQPEPKNIYNPEITISDCRKIFFGVHLMADKSQVVIINTIYHIGTADRNLFLNKNHISLNTINETQTLDENA